jgi:hypothetical protein
MRGYRRFIGILLSPIILASPAIATSYSTSAFLDFSTLSFSGVSVRPLASSVLSQTLFTFTDGSTTGGSRSSWAAETVSQRNSQIGEAVALGDSTLMRTSASLIGSTGNLSSFASRDASFIVNSTGYLTVSIRYALQQSGLLAPTRVGGSFVSMDFVFLSNGIADQVQTQGALSGTNSKAGTLSLTQWFDAGHEATLNLRTTSFAQQVPEPDTLLLMAFGLVSIGVLMKWRQVHAS